MGVRSAGVRAIGAATNVHSPCCGGSREVRCPRRASARWESLRWCVLGLSLLGFAVTAGRTARAQEDALAAVATTKVVRTKRPAGAKRSASRRVKDPHRHARYAAYFAEAAQVYQLPIELLWAVARVESDFVFTAVSGKKALGLMQLMPFNLEKMGVSNAFDARQNILGGARLLRLLANQWGGDIPLTLASYNAGANAVKRYGGVPPYKETQRYVRRVMAFYNAYRAARRAATEQRS
jgi:soluble lytic murein transglycosylase-like protein